MNETMTKSQRKKDRHDGIFNYSKGKVTVTCSCGLVRKYEDEARARQGFGAHLASRKRNHKEEVADA